MFQGGKKEFVLFHSTFCFITHSLTIWFVRVYEGVRWLGVYMCVCVFEGVNEPDKYTIQKK